MRFGIKTSPQETTWADMLAVWQAADEIDLFESGWTSASHHPVAPGGPAKSSLNGRVLAGAAGSGG